MKKNILLIALLALTIISCDEWLEVTPPENVEETELFSTGEGYRNALNGVYKNLSSNSMYAKEMTWGFLDVLGNCYISHMLPNNGVYKEDVANYNYDNSRVKSILEGIWQNSYKSIANCNNLIQNIENEDVKMFEGGSLEKNMIKGEAIALRSFIHFDLLRLFAPALVNDDGANYIPYCDIYPSILKERESLESCLDKIKRDLVEAKELVGSFDTIPEHKIWLYTVSRIEGGGKDGGNKNFLPDDLFYGYRGFRMNYYAISAILARVYSYAGELENAYKEAEKVCNAECRGSLLFNFTNDHVTPKLYEGVIFALSNKKLVENFKPYDTGDSQYLCVNPSVFYGEKTDVRFKTMKKTENNDYAPLISKKYVKMDQDSHADKIHESMIPIVRISELYYIMGEYLYSTGKTQEAIDKLQEVRIARKVVNPLPQYVYDEESYRKALIGDAKREFIGEGQLFYMYKKYNIFPSWYMYDASSFVLPIPDSEDINF